MTRSKRLARFIGNASVAAIILATVCSSSSRAQFANQFNPDFQFGNKPGSVAVRGPNGWTATPPGALGQFLVSNGAGLPTWQTPTGSIQTQGTPSANQLAVWTTATQLQGVSGGGAALDLVGAFTGLGYVKRTASGTYSVAAIPLADLPTLDLAHIPNLDAAHMPAFTGTDCTSAAGSAVIDCSKMLAASHTYTALQTYNNGAKTDNVYSVSGGTAMLYYNNRYTEVAGSDGQQYILIGASAFDTGMYLTSPTIYLRNPQGTLYASFGNGLTSFATPVPVSSGGTGQTSGGGAALDAIAGSSFTGCAPGSGSGANCIMQRSGANSYIANTLSQYLDNVGSTQGSILYRSSGAVQSTNAWKALPPGTSGQFLASNGGGADPSWAAPSAPPAGSRVLLNTITPANGSANVTDTTSISASYKEYDILVEGLLPTTSAYCQLQLYTSGTLQTSGYSTNGSYADQYSGGTIGAIASQTTYIPCSQGTGDLVASQGVLTNAAGLDANVKISQPARATRQNLSGTFNADGNGAGGDSSGRFAAVLTGPITGFRLTFNGSTIAGGIIKVYGSN